MNGSLTPRELSEWQRAGRPLRLVDVREESEWLLVRLPEAEWRPFSAWPSWIEEVAAAGPEPPIVFYCHHGVRSAQACLLLGARGGPQAWNLAGGIERWAADLDPAMIRY